MPLVFRQRATFKGLYKGKYIFEINESFYHELDAIAKKFKGDIFLPFWKSGEDSELKNDSAISDLFDEEKFFIKVKETDDHSYVKAKEYDLTLNLKYLKTYSEQKKEVKCMFFHFN